MAGTLFCSVPHHAVLSLLCIGVVGRLFIVTAARWLGCGEQVCDKTYLGRVG